MAYAVDDEDKKDFDGVGNEVTVPKERGEIMGHNPEHGDNHQGDD